MTKRKQNRCCNSFLKQTKEKQDEEKLIAEETQPIINGKVEETCSYITDFASLEDTKTSSSGDTTAAHAALYLAI